MWRSPVVAGLAGAAAWTAAEYGLHRFAMHEMKVCLETEGGAVMLFDKRRKDKGRRRVMKVNGGGLRLARQVYDSVGGRPSLAGARRLAPNGYR